MSEYIVCEASYANLDILKEALEDIGVPKEAIVVHEEAVELSGGYHRKEKANIVISKVAVGTIHDMGFKKTSTGYAPVVYDADARGFGKKFLKEVDGGTGELIQSYVKHTTLREIKKAYGHRLKSCKKNKNKIEILIDA